MGTPQQQTCQVALVLAIRARILVLNSLLDTEAAPVLAIPVMIPVLNSPLDMEAVPVLGILATILVTRRLRPACLLPLPLLPSRALFGPLPTLERLCLQR